MTFLFLKCRSFRLRFPPYQPAAWRLGFSRSSSAFISLAQAPVNLGLSTPALNFGSREDVGLFSNGSSLYSHAILSSTSRLSKGFCTVWPLSA